MYTVQYIYYSSNTLLLSSWLLLGRGPPVVACLLLASRLWQAFLLLLAVTSGPAVTGIPAFAVGSFSAVPGVTILAGGFVE